MYGFKHQAYNTFSGEILTTTNGNHLKRSVARLNRYESDKAIARKYAKSWRFSHNGKFTGGK